MIRLLSALFGLIGVGILLKLNSYACRSVTAATFDWGRRRKPEHGVLSVKACHLSVKGGANRGHLPLEKVTYAECRSPLRDACRCSSNCPVSVPPACECHSHSRVAAARFARTEEGFAWGGQHEGLNALEMA